MSPGSLYKPVRLLGELVERSPKASHEGLSMLASRSELFEDRSNNAGSNRTLWALSTKCVLQYRYSIWIFAVHLPRAIVLINAVAFTGYTMSETKPADAVRDSWIKHHTLIQSETLMLNIMVPTQLSWTKSIERTKLVF
jgi:hypothetical protein